jgi:hypothetical protein
VGSALARHEALGTLLLRVRDSRARLSSIQAVLPPGLREAVEAGPLDDTTWVLLVQNAGAAAKLRQYLPQLEARLADAGHAPRTLRVKLTPR